jgi:uncharacterized membrane protein YdfJ with MMPL/SSD domain
MTQPESPDPPRPGAAGGALARGYAFVIVALRFFIIGGWIAALALAVHFLPPLTATASGGLDALIPKNTPAASAEAEAARLFGAPLDAPVAVVQRDARGMPKAALDRSVRQAITVDQALSGHPGNQAQDAQAATALAEAGYPDAAQVAAGPASPGPPGGIPGLAGAVPLPNVPGLIRGTREQSTTVITFLYFRPGTSLTAQTAGADAYVHWYLSYPSSDVVGVTGAVPAEVAQDDIIQHYLPWVELFTVLAIALIVGIRFRAVGAPLVTLACAGTAYLLSIRVVAWAAERMGASLPADVGPVLVVLLLGVTTDYVVFFLSGMRARLAEGVPRGPAARLATAEFAPIILAAGLIVAASTASLMVARDQSLRDFGPALALTVLTAMAVSMTLAPALMSVFGSLLFRSVPDRRLAPGGRAYLLFASVLAVFASLGLTLLLSRYFLGVASLVYFVPIAGGVLLVSLGSDYNVFVAGRIWEEARHRPLRDAVRVAVPRASRAITTAGVALAASFAMLAVIPLEQFRQIALLMGIGVILDAVVVRSVLVPALVVLFGRVGTWPAPRWRQRLPEAGRADIVMKSRA